MFLSVVAVLAAAAAAKSTPTPKPKAAATAKPAATAVAKPAPAGSDVVEMTMPESVLGALLTAAAPFDETMEQEIGALGFTKTVQVKVHLTDPKVHVAADGVHVTLNYHLTDASGLVDTEGVATPLLTITPVPSKQVLEAKFTQSGIALPGGVEMPLEELVDPIEIPAVMPQDIDVGDKTVVAEMHASEVLMEEGRIRLRGTVTFHPKGK